MLAWLLAAGCLGCGFEDVDLRGKECPCAPGWVCDSRTVRCVRQSELDGGADASSPDDSGAPSDARVESDGGLRVDAGGDLDAGEDMDAAVAVDSGGSHDAGVDSGSGADAGPDPTACDDVLAGAVFCDGFEDPGLSAWNSSYGTGVYERVTAPPRYRGLASLHAYGTAPGQKAALERDPVAGLSGEIHMRGYVYIPSGFALYDINLFYTGTGSGGLGLGLESGDRPRVWVDAEGDAVTAVSVTVPRDTWTCLRMRATISNSAGIVQIWVNDTLAAEGTGLDTDPGGTYDRFSVGLTYSHPSSDAAAVYVDEVAIGTSPLPCD